MWITFLILAVVISVVFYSFLSARRAKRLQYIESYEFHPSLTAKVLDRYPQLDPPQIDTVFAGLRDYFKFCAQARRRMVSMPSQVVDVAWHEFILFTRAYEQFSRKGIGRFLHHTPTEAMTTPTLAQDGIKRAWRLACANEGINPSAPDRLPLLFSIDSQLGIEDGFRYSLNCRDKSSPNYGEGYCAGHIACASGCGGDSGGTADSGGVFDGSGCGSNCGGGCGGD